MPCGFCKQSGHTRPSCPHVIHRQKYIYQIICCIFGYFQTYNKIDFIMENANVPSDIIVQLKREYAFNVLRSLKTDSFHLLYSYLLKTFPQEIQFVPLRTKAQMIECIINVFANETMAPVDMFQGLSMDSIRAEKEVHRNSSTPSIVTRHIWRRDNTYVQVGHKLRPIYNILHRRCLHNITVTKMTFGPLLGTGRTVEEVQNYARQVKSYSLDFEIRIRRLAEARYHDSLLLPILQEQTNKMVEQKNQSKRILVVCENNLIHAPQDNNECPICLSEYTADTVAKLNCGHFTCTKCVMQCDAKKPQHNKLLCSLCRVEIVELTVNQVSLNVEHTIMY